MSLNNKLIERVYVGAERENDGPITKGFIGCLEVRAQDRSEGSSS